MPAPKYAFLFPYKGETGVCYQEDDGTFNDRVHFLLNNKDLTIEPNSAVLVAFEGVWGETKALFRTMGPARCLHFPEGDTLENWLPDYTNQGTYEATKHRQTPSVFFGKFLAYTLESAKKSGIDI